MLEAVRTILETTMEDELAAELVATRYQRTPWRTDLRNGSYQRTLVTELGAITDLRIPRRRLVPYHPSFLVRAARRTTCVDRVLRQAFLRGLSTRETAALAETLTGVSLPPVCDEVARECGWSKR
ncbi:MAG TPA: transposase [Candidatus Limnocylindria bacterium]|nr:transposase [Candidatus Limnocylindria bacterium]